MNPRADFRTVTGTDMRHSIKWAKSVENTVSTQISTLRRTASRAEASRGSVTVLGARSAASTFPAGPLPSNDRKEVRTLERL
jgi:hypothetical protein